MGIDKFLNQFDKSFKISRYIDENSKIQCDNIELIFDFNSIIHNSIHDLDKLETNDDDTMIDIVCSNFIKHITNTTYSNTHINISIFLDGVPSLNKMYEQKHRKFYG